MKIEGTVDLVFGELDRRFYEKITIVLLLIASSTAVGCAAVPLKNAGPVGSSIEVAPVMAEAAAGSVEAFKQELDNPTVNTDPTYVPTPSWEMHLLPVPNKRK